MPGLSANPLAIPELRTGRLILRAPQAEDHPAYAAFYADAEASAFYGGPLDDFGAWNKLAQDLGSWALTGHGMWALERQEAPGCIGACGIVTAVGWPRPELTWWIAPEARRKGYAKEASQAVIRWAYGSGWDLVQTHMKDENAAARALVLGLGGEKFARERFPDGLERDIFRLPRPKD